MTERRTGSDPALYVSDQPPADWRERERAALKRLFDAVGRRPTKDERAKAEEIAVAAEQWRARRSGGSDSAR
ncbi:MAG: hypothetical protein ACRDT2_05980 [Natronosporangium sp.]